MKVIRESIKNLRLSIVKETKIEEYKLGTVRVDL